MRGSPDLVCAGEFYEGERGSLGDRKCWYSGKGRIMSEGLERRGILNGGKEKGRRKWIKLICSWMMWVNVSEEELVEKKGKRGGTKGDRRSVSELCMGWRLAARWGPPGGDGKTVGLGGRWRLAVSEYRQAVWNSFAWRPGRFMDGVTCDDMSGEVPIKLLSRGDTSGEVRSVGLRAGGFIEQDYERGGSSRQDHERVGSCEHQIPEFKANKYSPFLFVCGDDRVIRYSGADVDTGGAEDVQMAE
ncbi:hypothetical protein DEO72_LG8g1908 [Vigna unguiculata]|uniref:Uncharacterized protein n=1 Tax=Vigna unguiculata TaxID=3917 RepID=A0A4D6MUT4_VIGUN|nr:hypothetical protein DEO72_LG8g1908 [Vigna unguiculata]